jgi:hypothetical protein
MRSAKAERGLRMSNVPKRPHAFSDRLDQTISICRNFDNFDRMYEQKINDRDARVVRAWASQRRVATDEKAGAS